MRRRTLALVLAVLTVASACASSGPPSPLSAAPPLAAEVEGSSVIAVLAPDSTGIAGAAKRTVSSLRTEGVAIGGSLGVVDAEPGDDLAETLAVIDRFLDQDPVLLIVGCDREVALAAARVAADHDVLVMSPCVTAPQFGDQRHAGYSLMASSGLQGELLAEEALVRRHESAVVVSDVDSVDSYAQCSAFIKRFVGQGGQIYAELDVGELAEANSWPIKRSADVVVSCLEQDEAASSALTIREFYDGEILTGPASLHLAGDEELGDLTVSANLAVSGRWTYGAATKALVEIFAEVASAGRGRGAESMSTRLDQMSVFDTSVGRVRFEERRNVAPIRLRRGVQTSAGQ